MLTAAINVATQQRMIMNDNNARLIAAVATVLIATGVFLFLYLFELRIDASQLKEKEKGEIVLVEPEEFVEVIEPLADPVARDVTPAEAHLDEPVKNESQAAPAAGTDLEDAGPQGEKHPVMKSPEPSPVKVKEEPKPEKPKGQANKPKEEKQEPPKRKENNQANDEVARAFGKHNANTSNTSDKGNSGSNSNQSSTTTGTGRGKVGGGWIIPAYGAVRSTVTGSVNLTVKIDKTGRVTSVTVTGGTPPAATDAGVKSSIEREIRSRKFTRASYDDAEPATAYITYTFR